jgi:glycosyltransferase involved in cell wall biosynthesis
MQQHSPFFSIILPTFNRAHLLKRALDSVLAQTFTDWELLIIDDGSSDNTREAIQDYLLDPRISYSFEVNSGPAMARNRGIASARGEYITFIDSDDEYLPEHLQTRYESLENSQIDLMHGGLEIVGDPYVADRFDNTKLVHITECCAAGTFFIKRELADALGGFRDMLYGDDADFEDRARAQGAKIMKVDFPTYRYYRDQPDSLCSIAEREGEAGIIAYRNRLTDDPTSLA